MCHFISLGPILLLSKMKKLNQRIFPVPSNSNVNDYIYIKSVFNGVIAAATAAAAKSLQLCLTPCDPIDGSPPGSPFPGILQARTMEWVAISFSNGVIARPSEIPLSFYNNTYNSRLKVETTQSSCPSPKQLCRWRKRSAGPGAGAHLL